MEKNKVKDNTIIKVSFRRAIGLFLGAIITGVVGGIFAGLSIINADHFALATLTTRVDAIEENIVPRTEFQLQVQNLGTKIENNNNNIQDNKNYLIRIESKIDRVIGGE